MKNKLNILLFVSLLFTNSLFGQYKQENDGYFSHPKIVGDHIIVSDNFASNIYIIKENKIVQQFNSPGIGNYLNISKDEMSIGLKMIDMRDYNMIILDEPVEKCGQVSFSSLGDTTYTIGDQLVILRSSGKEILNLGTYSNIAPISPNGKSVVFNDEEDQLWWA